MRGKTPCLQNRFSVCCSSSSPPSQSYLWLEACGPTGARCAVVRTLSVATSVHLGTDRWCGTKVKRVRRRRHRQGDSSGGRGLRMKNCSAGPVARRIEPRRGHPTRSLSPRVSWAMALSVPAPVPQGRTRGPGEGAYGASPEIGFAFASSYSSSRSVQPGSMWLPPTSGSSAPILARSITGAPSSAAVTASA